MGQTHSFQSRIRVHESRSLQTQRKCGGEFFARPAETTSTARVDEKRTSGTSSTVSGLQSEKWQSTKREAAHKDHDGARHMTGTGTRGRVVDWARLTWNPRVMLSGRTETCCVNLPGLWLAPGEVFGRTIMSSRVWTKPQAFQRETP